MRKLLLVIVLTLFSVLYFPFVSAKDVEVSLYLLNIGRFDIATGAFTADFYLHFKCKSYCEPQKFEFVNGRATKIDIIEDKLDSKFYRIEATLHSPADLRQFPFDEQEIKIILEDTKTTIEDLVYVPMLEESGVDDSIAFPGWDIKGWNAEAKNHYYPVYNETYSQYIFTVTISRIPLSSFIKTFLPVLLILLIVLFSLLLGTAHIPEILAMSGSSLIATVMFHISISNQIPPIGYLTFADKFMIVTYIIILTTFVINTFMLGLIEKKKIKLADTIHKYAKYNIFIMAVLLFIILFVFFL